MRFISIRSVINGLILLLAAACATPTSPTGGPPDREGPQIISTEPETGTTNFDGRSITFRFSEFVNRGSITNAIVVEPDVGIPYSLGWGRKSLSVKFEDELPELTTLIVTIGTNLSDMNGNKMVSPYKVAVSTGPEIDKGQISGRILDAQTGKGAEGHRVLLYRKPVDLTATAAYSAETDTGGTFQFSYLSPGDYKAIWVDDLNRNRIWDRERERAQPFQREFISLQKAAEDTLETLYIAQSDTTKPVFQGVGLFSSRRLRMRFSENIELTDSTHIVINDSLGNIYSDVYPLYIDPADPYILYAHSEEPLAPEDSFEVVLNNIADAFGNVQPVSAQPTTGSAQSDTTAQRTIRRLNQAGLFPDEPMEIIYAGPITGQVIQDSLKIVAGTELVEDTQSYIRVEQNRLIIAPPDGWKAGLDYEVRVWDPSQNTYKNVTPTIWHPSDLGDLNVQLEDTTLTNTYRLILKTEERGVMADTTFSRHIEITDLPPLSYQAIVYEDLNDNNRWDQGQVEPFQAPEPYFIQNNIPVRSNFTADLYISISRRQPE